MYHRVLFIRLIALLVAFWTPFVPTVLAGDGDTHRVVFVTSVTGNGNFGSWPDAGDATGLEAADAICQARAAAGGLNNSGNFVAWLSDAADDAYCRIHNLSGKKATNCGLAELPVSAGPWIRTDSFPFSESIDQLLSPNGVVYSPLIYDEFGAAISGPVRLFSATNDSGVLNIGGTNTDCAAWMSDAPDTFQAGASEKTTQSWTNFGSGNCSNIYPLICMETVAGPNLPAITTPGRIAFVTNNSGNGQLGSWPDAGKSVGIAAGDAICQTQAEAAGLDDPLSFKAWLSDSTTHAIERFVNDGRWVRPDGVPVAENKADLTDGQLFSSINVTAEGNYVGNFAVWTGTGPSGFAASDWNCDNWEMGVAGPLGGSGRANDVLFWTHPLQNTCNSTFLRLYCLSDAQAPEAPILADGFESVACTLEFECNYLDVAAACDLPQTCQGTATQGICFDSFCMAESVDDDSGCEGQESASCGQYAPVFCTSETDQPIDQEQFCANSCVSDADCASGAHCDGDSQCVPDVCGDGMTYGIELCDDFNTLACGSCSAGCDVIQTPAAATGTITTITAAQILDGETLTVPDGFNSVVFEFDLDGSVAGGVVPVNLLGLVSASEVRDAIIAAINGVAAGLTVTASIGGADLVSLSNDVNSALGNQPLNETVADTGFMVSGMSGGVAGDCPAFTGCLSNEDCASGSCTSNQCD